MVGISVGTWLGAPDGSVDGEREEIKDGSRLRAWLGPLDGPEDGHCAVPVGTMVGFPTVVGLELVLGRREGCSLDGVLGSSLLGN